MIRADIAVRVRRCTTAGIAQSLKGEQWSRHRWRLPPDVFEQLLDVCEARCCGFRRGARLVVVACITRQTSFLEFLLGCVVRKFSQILVETDRSNQLHYFRTLC